jgi:phosphoribosyl 1,2-cyclic phosphodiesterase
MGNGYQLSFCPLPHGKIVSMGVKIQHGESSWCVLTDLSLRTDDNQKTPHFKRIAEFCRGAELLIADATYDHQDFEAKPFLLGYGHSAAEDVMAMAAASGVKALVLAHHDPMLCDEALTNRASRITQFAKDQGFGFQPRLAQPGLWQPNSPPANLRPQNTREVA